MIRWFKNWLTVHCEVRRGFILILEILMTTQEKIDAIALQIETATTAIRADIDALKAANPTVDFSKLDSSVGKLEALDAENPAPPVP